MVRGILFDLDGTLFDRDAAIRALVTDQHSRFSGPFAGVDLATYLGRVLELDAHGHGDKVTVYQQVVAQLALPPALAAVLAMDFWERYHAFCKRSPESLSVLTELRRRGFKLGVITNGREEIQGPVIRRLGLTELLDVTLISEREGVRKPDRRIFERALARLDLRPEDAWYVGDHPGTDVAGAVGAGLSAVWKRTPYWPTPDCRHLEIDDLSDLLGLVDRISARE